MFRGVARFSDDRDGAVSEVLRHKTKGEVVRAALGSRQALRLGKMVNPKSDSPPPKKKKKSGVIPVFEGYRTECCGLVRGDTILSRRGEQRRGRSHREVDMVDEMWIKDGGCEKAGGTEAPPCTPLREIHHCPQIGVGGRPKVVWLSRSKALGAPKPCNG